jgi:5-hmdU DNA kinase-like protein
VKPIKWRKDQLKLFFYWMNERHNIYLKRKAGEKWPWTKDKILREYKFTNVFRQLDRVTEEWTKRYIARLGGAKKLSDGDLLFQCAMFRLFNWPDTYDCLYYNMGANWNTAKAIKLLTDRQHNDHEQIFTGAYIIPNAGRTEPKVQVICEALDELYKQRDKLAKRIRKARSMERAVEFLETIPTIGGFIGYEIACDLRHTRLLSDATDILSWANPGPGAKRGIHRLLAGSADKLKGLDYNKHMRALLVLATDRDKPVLGDHIFKCEWPFEMREIEHSLCEFDKMMRVKNGEGRPRSKYRPPIPKQLDLLE